MSEQQKGFAFPAWAEALIAVLVVVLVLQTVIIAQLSTGRETENQEEAQASEATTGETDGEPFSARELFPDDPWWGGDAFDPGLWDPYLEMQRMRERMDLIFGEALGRFERSERFENLFDDTLPQSPKTDLRETDDAYVVTVDLPGSGEPNVEVDITGQTLRIRTEIDEETSDQESSGKMLRRERRVGRYERTLNLPEPVESEKMATEVKDGVLRVTVPKAGLH